MMSGSVFYSWQTDTGSKQRRLIRESLDAAAESLAAKKDGNLPSVSIDDATRDIPGSPNISDSIRDKIWKADVFVADVTLINGAGVDGKESRRTPNPNVMFELGFAVAELGWDRVIMLFDKTLPMEAIDLPFDVRAHRASPFKGSDAASLKSLLVEAIGLVLLKQPPRPRNSTELSLEQIQRDRDIRALRAALTCIDLTVFDRMLDSAPGIIVRDAFHHYFCLEEVVSASTFRLYDKAAGDLVRKIYDSWGGLLSFGVHYTDLNSGDHKFKSHIGAPVTESIESDWQAMLVHVKELRESMDRLVEHVHQCYVELDVQELSELAAQERVAFRKRMHWT